MEKIENIINIKNNNIEVIEQTIYNDTDLSEYSFEIIDNKVISMHRTIRNKYDYENVKDKLYNYEMECMNYIIGEDFDSSELIKYLSNYSFSLYYRDYNDKISFNNTGDLYDYVCYLMDTEEGKLQNLDWRLSSKIKGDNDIYRKVIDFRERYKFCDYVYCNYDYNDDNEDFINEVSYRLEVAAEELESDIEYLFFSILNDDRNYIYDTIYNNIDESYRNDIIDRYFY